MSKVKRYTDFDNDPNSIFGASRKVLQDYKRVLERKEAPTKGFKQGVKTEAGDEVTKNLNEFAGLIKGITNNIDNALIYLEEEPIPEEPNLLEGYSGSGRAYRYRGGAPPAFKTRDEARNYLFEKYAGKTGNMDEEDRKLITKWQMLKEGYGNTKNASKLLDKIENSPNPSPITRQPTIMEMYNKPDPFAGLVEEQMASAKSKGKSALDDDLEEEEEEAEERYEQADEELNARAEGLPRFTDRVKAPQITGGEPEFDDEGDLDEQDVIDLNDLNENWLNAQYGEEPEGEEAEEMAEEDEGEDIDGRDSDTSATSEAEEFGDYFDDEDPEEVEDAETVPVPKNIKTRPVEVKEKYILTLLSTINSQILKASDLWESNITPNLSLISKIKMDSFVNSKTMKEFEDAIKELEDSSVKHSIVTHYNFLNKVYDKVISSLDELFNLINNDIKRYSAGIYISGGFIPLKNAYNPFLRTSATKYLM